MKSKTDLFCEARPWTKCEFPRLIFHSAQRKVGWVSQSFGNVGNSITVLLAVLQSLSVCQLCNELELHKTTSPWKLQKATADSSPLRTFLRRQLVECLFSLQPLQCGCLQFKVRTTAQHLERDWRSLQTNTFGCFRHICQSNWNLQLYNRCLGNCDGNYCLFGLIELCVLFTCVQRMCTLGNANCDVNASRMNLVSCSGQFQSCDDCVVIGNARRFTCQSNETRKY